MTGLAGRRVLVTGGSRGIGAACCRLFADAGATVALVYREREDAAREVVAELERRTAGPHRALQCDLGSPTELRRLLGTLETMWGSLDCLVNNAGVWLRNPLATLDAEVMEQTFRVNLSAVFRLTREALPLLARGTDPNIVNLSSTAGQRGEAFYSTYAASKGGIIALTKSWAVELAPGIRVNAVAPGWVETDMAAAALEASGEEIRRSIPLARIAAPEDIAGPVVFLASPLARHITGEILNVNGGSVLAG